MMDSTVPDTMTACVLHGKEDVRLERIPVPELQLGDILVRVEAALTCGTDLKVFLRGYHERMIQPPSVFGHEFAGEVVASDNGQFSAGTRIVAANSAPCWDCYFCELNKPNLCNDLLFANGAYAEYVRVPARIVEENCLTIPADLPAAKAALVEPLACAVKGVEDVAIQEGEKVLVIGAGPLGLMLARLSVLAGAEVTTVDDQSDRLAVAAELGVTGLHNVANALAALAMGDALGLPMGPMLSALRRFRGLPHRTQPVADVLGMRWIDDSKATNVGAAVAAIDGLPGPIVLIAGGDGKGQVFAPLASALRGRARAAVLLGRDAAQLADALDGVCPVTLVEDMASAVKAAAHLGQAGDTVLLAPACSSLDMFRSYAERGDIFTTSVRSLLS